MNTVKKPFAYALFFIILGVAFDRPFAQETTLDGQKNGQKKALPKWQLGAGFFYGIFPHYPASNHFYELMSPAPLFIYRFDRATLKRRELSLPMNKKTRLSLTFGLGLPVGKNNRQAVDFPKEVTDPNKRIVSNDNFHRRGMDEIPIVLKIGGQLGYELNPHIDLKLPVFLNVGLNGLDYQGYEFHPEVALSLKPYGDRSQGLNLSGSMEIRYADIKTHQRYYEVKEDEVIEGREAYKAQAGELVRSVNFVLSYRHRFNDDHSIRGFLGIRREDYSGSANTKSPLYVTSQTDLITMGISYYFYSSKRLVWR